MSLPASFRMRTVKGMVSVPSVGYGTISETPERLPGTVKNAIKQGVRLLDGAWEYGVSKEVGEGIRLSGVPREDLFICHKINPHFYKPSDVQICADQILQEMRLEYLDLLLLHLPVALKPLPDIASAKAYVGSSLEERRIDITKDNKWIIDAAHSTKDIAAANDAQGSIIPTWQAMADLVHAGKVRAIGVSNFSILQLEEILTYQSQTGDTIPLSANQVEMHPYAPNKALLAFMRDHEILCMAHSPFATFKWRFDPDTGDWPTDPLIPDGKPSTLLEHPDVQKLAIKNHMAVGQMIQSWAVQQGAIPLGRSTKEHRIKENLNVKMLSKEDMEALDSLECPGDTGKGLIFANVFPGIRFPEVVA